MPSDDVKVGVPPPPFDLEVFRAQMQDLANRLGSQGPFLARKDSDIAVGVCRVLLEAVDGPWERRFEQRLKEFPSGQLFLVRRADLEAALKTVAGLRDITRLVDAGGEEWSGNK